jgi:hypothetical protein
MGLNLKCDFCSDPSKVKNGGLVGRIFLRDDHWMIKSVKMDNIGMLLFIKVEANGWPQLPAITMV